MGSIIPAARITGERVVKPREMGGNEMEDKELAAIREKVNQLNILMATGTLKSQYMSIAELIAEDAPAMLAEVERLRAEFAYIEPVLAEKNRALAEYCMENSTLRYRHLQTQDALQQAQAREQAMHEENTRLKDEMQQHPDFCPKCGSGEVYYERLHGVIACTECDWEKPWEQKLFTVEQIKDYATSWLKPALCTDMKDSVPDNKTLLAFMHYIDHPTDRDNMANFLKRQALTAEGGAG